ncbi:hypothetical protein NFI96_023967 [Prochilodus magdalenae]|nr:hypothetical protein NFI96_023967 [Prochilodus magdalenae]
MATEELGAAGSDGLGRVPEEDRAEPPAQEEQEEEEKGRMERDWGFSLEELFGLALKFFKEMNGKAFNPTYEETLRLVALQKQVLLGPYNPSACADVGFFDVLGSDRRKEWASLGSMAKEDAMEDFVKLLNSCCSLFSPYVTSHKIEKEEQERRLREEEKRLRAEREEQERQKQEEERRLKEEEERRKQEEEERRNQEANRLLMVEQKRQIMAALNAQTAAQFQQYAQRQFPSSPDQQRLLVQQLQEQHYQQYIQQAYQVQQKAFRNQQDPDRAAPLSSPHSDVKNTSSQSDSLQSQEHKAHPKPCGLFIDGKPGDLPILAPSMWTRPQIKEFKEKMAQDADSVITVGRGEVLTVRVPTHEDGSYLFWEFATDHYDIGFGLYFEWPGTENGTRAESTGGPVSENPEAGQTEEERGNSESQTGSSLPHVSEVVPIYRRDSHEEVYAGSHQYPGHGVYLLKFDNSYSLWRTKVVYYRVYYTR